MFDQVMRPILVLLRCQLFFVGILAVVGLGTPNSAIVVFDSQNGSVDTSKLLCLKRKITKLDGKSTIKPGKNPKKDKWFHFHACTLRD